MIRGPDWEPTLDDPEIYGYLHAAAGDEGLAVFRYILENEPVTGEDILEAHADQKPSHVRKLLYALMQEHALEYHKDTDSKGWETFTWATDLPEIKLIHLRRWREEHRDLVKHIKFLEDHEFYACGNEHGAVLFEDAMDQEFKCKDCGDAMEPHDVAGDIAALTERVNALAPALQN